MEDFFAELDASLSNVGSTKLWKRTIGDVVIWMSPITLHGQQKVTEVLNSPDSVGINVINETKRITLSFSIVGINDLDMREYRDNVPRFPVQGKDGKTVKVTLDKYLYQKMTNWSAQFIDDTFAVLADLLESDQKENLKNIKFENQKNSETELTELEARVSVLRSELGKPQLVESKPNEPEVQVAAVSETPQESPATSTKPVVEVDFDPFAKMNTNVVSPAVASPAASMPIPEIPDNIAAKAQSTTMDKQVRDKEGNLINAFVSNPSGVDEVLESRAESVPARPVIDPPVMNRNPRFSPPVK